LKSVLGCYDPIGLKRLKALKGYDVIILQETRRALALTKLSLRLSAFAVNMINGMK
jgi:hypothetical protein